MEADDESVDDEEDLAAEQSAPGPSSKAVMQPATNPSEVVRLKLPATAARAYMSAPIGSSSEEGTCTLHLCFYLLLYVSFSEDEFSVGLNFPAVEHADSDEEEEKRMVPRKLSTSSSSSSQRRLNRRKLSGSSTSSSTTRTRSPANVAPPKPKAEVPATNSVAAAGQKSGKPVNRVPSELEPDFEMIDHNEVDD